MHTAAIQVLLLLGVLIATTLAVKPHKFCYKKFPILDGLLCYKECEKGYYHWGGGPVCWAKCPEPTTNLALFCTKNTYGRGVGVPLSTCTSTTEKNGLLCYPKCKRGYYGLGPVCWANCKDAYTDIGALCSRNAHIYGRDVGSCPWYDKCGLCAGPWYNVCGKRRNCGGKCKSGYKNDGCTCRKDLHTYAKATYGRGVGSAMGCKSNEEKNAALCYPPCDPGYKGVGPLCWGICSGETIDTGTQCQKKAYGRGVGKPINCLKVPQRSDITNYDGLVEIFKKADSFENLVAIGCSSLYKQVKFWLTLAQTFNNCIKKQSWQTVTISYSAGAAALAQVVGEVGIAVDTYTRKGLCYFGYCYGAKLDVSIGVDVGLGWWRSLDDIPGEARSFDLGLDIPFTEKGAGLSIVTGDDLTLLGVVFTVGGGIGGPIPFEVGWNKCNTPKKNTMPFTA